MTLHKQPSLAFKGESSISQTRRGSIVSKSKLATRKTWHQGRETQQSHRGCTWSGDQIQVEAIDLLAC